MELLGTGVDVQGRQHLGAAATVTIDRTDFGLTWNMLAPNGVLVGVKVKIEVDLPAIDAASEDARPRGVRPGRPERRIAPIGDATHGTASVVAIESTS